MISVLGFIIHVIFLLSIFDIYFKSPIVENVPPYKPSHKPLANRLVLFVTDGLRAESFFNYRHTPYLRFIASKTGLWGISNTRVPTESRPGHVAIIAGFYEDPSAIAKGWKKNPVDFDSVFNQSRFTFSWGADDILHIFSQGTNDDHIITNAYNTEDQNFSTDKNTTLLDAWVFNNVEAFLNKAGSDSLLKDKLKGDKIVFFLHLLGLDTSGHTHKPNTPDFIVNLKFVDEGIEKIVKVFEKFYNNDSRTAYILTSDHGMTDWGSHGAGDEDETQTPYIVWGSGINGIIEEDNINTQYGLPLSRRLDIKQADFAPLMSTILSVPVPVNSIGILPDRLLKLPMSERARAIYSNSRQLASQYNEKRIQVETDAIKWLYKPYQPFTEEKYEAVIVFMEKLLADEQYEKLIILSKDIMELSLNGLSYYYNYYQTFLLLCTSLSFIGWIVNLLLVLMEHTTNVCVTTSKKGCKSMFRKAEVNMMFGIILAVTFSLIYIQKLPFQYLIYTATPILLWWRIFAHSNIYKKFSRELFKCHTFYELILKIILYIVGTVCLVYSFSNRWALSIPLFVMSVWPLFSKGTKKLDLFVRSIWAVSCIMLGVFAFLPVVGKETHITLVISAGLLWILIMLTLLTKYLSLNKDENTEHRLIYIQLFVLVLALHNIYVQSVRFDTGSDVVVSHQVIAWIIAGVSLLFSLLSSNSQIYRLLSVESGLLTVYAMLSVSHEVLFLVTLIINLTCWLLIEYKMTSSNRIDIKELSFISELDVNRSLLNVERNLAKDDFRRAFFFLTYIILSFFGTGNIASINSFEVRWVTCFVTTFRPFVITTLILLKTLIPFLIVACCFRALNIITKAPTGYLIIIVLIFSDMMGLQFLFMVKNVGSWLEIGSSISQYVISEAITLFTVLLYYIAIYITEFNLSSHFRLKKKYV